MSVWEVILKLRKLYPTGRGLIHAGQWEIWKIRLSRVVICVDLLPALQDQFQKQSKMLVAKFLNQWLFILSDLS